MDDSWQNLGAAGRRTATRAGAVLDRPGVLGAHYSGGQPEGVLGLGPTSGHLSTSEFNRGHEYANPVTFLALNIEG